LFEQLISLLPREPGSAALLVASIGSVAGAGLYLAGARFSRAILTLSAVAIGAGVGVRLPGWFGWGVDGMGPAVGGAVILGVSAFAMPRLWIGLWLGAVLTCWTALAAWIVLGHGHANRDWNWPAYQATMTLPRYLNLIWLQLPADVTKILPMLAGIAMAVGTATGVLWPKVGGSLMWSGAGASLLLSMGALALQRLSPSTLNHLPRQTWAQLTLIASVVLVGAIWQWWSMPKVQQASEGQSEESPSKASKPKGNRTKDAA
jgi:hypothetical protein